MERRLGAKSEQQECEAIPRPDATSRAMEIATWTWDIHGGRAVADRNMAALFSAPRPEASGSMAACLTAVHPEDSAGLAALIRNAIETGCAYEATYRMRRPDGGYRVVIARGRPEYGLDGKALRLPGVTIDFNDITNPAATETQPE